MCTSTKSINEKDVANSISATFDDLRKELNQQKNVYESKDCYCYLVAYYSCPNSTDDGIRMLNFGSNRMRDAKTIDALVEYIPKHVNILMEKPKFANFKLLMKPQEKMYQPQWLLENPEELFSIIVNIA